MFTMDYNICNMCWSLFSFADATYNYLCMPGFGCMPLLFLRCIADATLTLAASVLIALFAVSVKATPAPTPLRIAPC